MELQLRAALEPATANDKDRSIDLVWSTGAAVKRADYVEVLSMDPKHVRLERLNNGAPVLDTHDRSSLRGVIGAVVPGTARIVGGDGVARVRFSQRAEVTPIWNDVRAGIVRSVSVGYAVHRWKIDGNIRTAIDWEPHELSMVPIPADAGASTRSRQSETAQLTVRGHDMSSIARTKYENTLADMGLNAKLIDAERSQIALGIATGLGLVARREYDSEAFRAGRSLDVTQIARYCLWRNNIDPTRLETSAAIQRALSLDDFQGAMIAVAEIIVSSAWNEVVRPYRAIAKRVTSRRSKLRAAVVAAGGALPKVPELGELQRRPPGVTYGDYTIEHYASIVDISRQLLVNAELSIIAEILRQKARAAALTTTQAIRTALLTNAGSYFDVTRGNTTSAAAGSCLTATVLKLARESMRNQIASDGSTAGFRLSHIIIGPALEDAAEVFFSQRRLPESDDPAALRNPTVLVDPEIDGENFYAFDASGHPLEVAYFSDEGDGLEVSQERDFARESLGVKLSMDVGVGLADWRAAFRVVQSS